MRAPGLPPSSGPSDAGGSGDVEVDLYAGKRGQLSAADIGYDVGVLAYVYADNGLKNMPAWPTRTRRKSTASCRMAPPTSSIRTPSPTCSVSSTARTAAYLDIGANIDLTNGWTGNLHAGHQKVNNNDARQRTRTGKWASRAISASLPARWP